jgi:hypothetical protein
MLRTLLLLICAGEGCKEFSRGFEGAIFTARDVRREMRAEGWTRVGMRDLCPKCSAKKGGK